MDRLTEAVVTIAVAIIGLATLAVLVSRNANTTGVINAGGGVFNSWLATAESPVTGHSSATYNFGQGGFGGMGGGFNFNLPSLMGG